MSAGSGKRLGAAREKLTWTAPKGETIEAVFRDVVRQVIRNYGETLRKLANR